MTTHKLDLLAAARDMLDGLDHYAELLGEVSCISKRGGRLLGTALDPISGGLALQALAPPGYFARSGSEVCILGAGGSSLALTAYLLERSRKGDSPSAIAITNRSTSRLESMRKVHAGLADFGRRPVSRPRAGLGPQLPRRA